VYEAEALIDSDSVRTALPEDVVEIAKYADGRQETLGLTKPVLIEIEGRETIEGAMVLGDMVLRGQTVLETLDLLVDCKNQPLIPNPENPEKPVLRV
jgi:hypothetical protein